MHLADVYVRTGGGVAPEPQGIIGHPDVTAVSVTTPGQPTWAEVISFEDALFAATVAVLRNLKPDGVVYEHLSIDEEACFQCHFKGRQDEPTAVGGCLVGSVAE